MAKTNNRYETDLAYRNRINKGRWSKKVIREWMNGGFVEDVRENADFKEAIRFYIGTGLGSGGKKGQIYSEIRLMLEEGPVKDIMFFKKYDYGRTEMNEVVKYFIKDVSPEERIWIAYDSSEEEYYIFDECEDIPENWVGYVPRDWRN